MSGNDRLTRKQEKAVCALLSEPTIVAAAEKAGVAEITVRRWLKLPAFLSRYREACRQMVDTAIGRLQEACAEAVVTLREVMGDAEAPVSSRVTAARAVLEMSLKAVELQDLEVRVDALEEAANIGRRFAA